MRRVAARIPFAVDALAVWRCARDPAPPGGDRQAPEARAPGGGRGGPAAPSRGGGAL